jgi:glycosyltransferase involved in cell wall biosynthesis
MKYKKKNQIVISPSGNFYGSEQVLYDFLKTNEVKYSVYAPHNSIFFEILSGLTHKHSIKSFRNVYTLYARLFFRLLFANSHSVYANEGGHIKWIVLLSKIFGSKLFIVHIRIIEDINRIPKHLPKNLKIVTISKFMLEQIDRKHAALFAYDPFTFNTNLAANRGEVFPIKIGIIGRISVNKGIFEISELIKCFAKSNHTSTKSVVFQFYGTESLDMKSQEIISELKLNFKNYCDFMGFVDTKKIYEHIDLVVHLARYEPLGRIFFEALDAGIPLVGFNSGGIGELGQITNLENNLIVYEDTNWTDKMVSKIYDIIENYVENKELIISTKQSFKSYFNQNIYNNTLNKIIENKLQ